MTYIVSSGTLNPTIPYRRTNQNERPVSVQVQSDVSRSLAQWIAAAGRPMSIVEDTGLQQTLCIEMCF